MKLTPEGEKVLAEIKASVPVAIERRTSARRKPIFEAGKFLTEDGEKLTPEEISFGKAIQAYKQKYRRPHPTWRQVLHVLKCLGYRCVTSAVEP